MIKMTLLIALGMSNGDVYSRSFEVRVENQTQCEQMGDQVISNLKELRKQRSIKIISWGRYCTNSRKGV